jgi:hypothetical protein
MGGMNYRNEPLSLTLSPLLRRGAREGIAAGPMNRRTGIPLLGGVSREGTASKESLVERIRKEARRDAEEKIFQN